MSDLRPPSSFLDVEDAPLVHGWEGPLSDDLSEAALHQAGDSLDFGVTNAKVLHGSLEGHDMSLKPSLGLRVAAVNLASGITVDNTQTRGVVLGEYLRDMRVDIALCSESGALHEQHIRAFRSGLRSVGFDVAGAPAKAKGAGTLVVFTLGNEALDVKHFEAGGGIRATFVTILGNWESVSQEEGGRGTGTRSVRVGAVYGFTGGTALWGLPAERDREKVLVDAIAPEVQRAVRDGHLVVVGGDFNAVVDPRLDAVNTGAVRRENSLLVRLLESGLSDPLRLHHPDSIFIMRQTTGGGGNRLDYLLTWSDPRLIPLASAIHRDHGMWGDHAIPLLDLAGIDIGVDAPCHTVEVVKWRQFLELAREASKSAEGTVEFEKQVDEAVHVFDNKRRSLFSWASWRTQLAGLRNAGVRNDEVRKAIEVIAMAASKQVVRVVGELGGANRVRVSSFERPIPAGASSSWTRAKLRTQSLLRSVRVGVKNPSLADGVGARLEKGGNLVDIEGLVAGALSKDPGSGAASDLRRAGALPRRRPFEKVAKWLGKLAARLETLVAISSSAISRCWRVAHGTRQESRRRMVLKRDVAGLARELGLKPRLTPGIIPHQLRTVGKDGKPHVIKPRSAEEMKSAAVQMYEDIYAKHPDQRLPSFVVPFVDSAGTHSVRIEEERIDEIPETARAGERELLRLLRIGGPGDGGAPVQWGNVVRRLSDSEWDSLISGG
ncbi:hypothetical protein CYMTET_18784 [Cymbomonas tetramitiformis]|uniref:Endonuclease/exonuclease/phosphatase domain-containing protein n=1 Tax=Cymbomonas tetramitiformis TaxID=36881 RepID=A0AAE0L5J7_9CHLO|nr:hypothetical protein CYMTET_18784 [Cymbomonas tetramitiformis]|eukprot:gene3841-4797_t